MPNVAFTKTFQCETPKYVRTCRFSFFLSLRYLFRMVVASHGLALPIDGSAATALVQLRNKMFFFFYIQNFDGCFALSSL